jgi:hypothetical protein
MDVLVEADVHWRSNAHPIEHAPLSRREGDFVDAPVARREAAGDGIAQ